MVFTEKQMEVLTSLSNWAIKNKFNSPQTAVLSGYAGTGKTTILNHFVHSAKVINKLNVALTATTHKAALELKKKTNEAAFTVHKFIGLSPDYSLDNFTMQNIKFIASAYNKMDNIDILIIDECSMINRELYKYITTKSELLNTKILFVGDPFQAPPIGEDISDCFEKSHVKLNLTEVLRQEKTNPIVKYSMKIRENKDFKIVFKEKESKNFNVSRDDLKFKKWIKENMNNSSKIIAHSNDKVKKYITLYRNILKKEKPFDIGEPLMMYSNSLELNMFNGEEYTILKREEKLKTFNNRYTGKSTDIKGFELLVQGEEEKKKIFVVDEKLQIEKVIFELDTYKTYAIREKDKDLKKAKFKEFFDLKQRYLFTRQISKDYGKDIDYAYAITIHKSQGSTYDNVFFDMSSLEYIQNQEERNKLIYVAVTRPRNNIYIYQN
jgi:exodeoxyribonuclease-5